MDRQKQIETLATKIMGWVKATLNDKEYNDNEWCTQYTPIVGDWYCHPHPYPSKRTRIVKCSDWNPFTSPADCEMLKAKICELDYYIGIERQPREWRNKIKEKDYTLSCSATIFSQHNYKPIAKCICGGDTEYEAVCLAALQLPECE